ncbi:MAG: GDSL-type esterase/lipase family protein [Solirubrobacteraceae bacterium]
MPISSRPSWPIILLAAFTAALLLIAGMSSSAYAGPRSASTAVVTMGDSYISGEAGRWLGNSINSFGNRDGTDRACVYTAGICTSYDRSKVYVGGSAANGCHRSDVAELLSARLAVDRRFNIACSGAVTKNLFRAADGGVGQNGEAAQSDQLAPIAQAYRVKLVVVSIGGNDLGFSSIITACLEHYEAKLGPCMPSQQAVINSKLPAAISGIEKAIDEIRAVMIAAGYARSDYRLVLQTYPSVIPRASDARYSELDPGRTLYGCPFYDQDLTWARDHAAPEIGGAVKTAAAARGVEVLDLGDAFAGHEFCAKTTQEATPFSFPSSAQAEWGRFLSASAIQQGDVQEVFHPDAYGQQALGHCLTQLYTLSTPGDFRCTDTPGSGPQAMTLARTATFVHTATVPDHPKIAVRGVPRRCTRSRWTILRIAVSGAAAPRTVKVLLGPKTIKRTHAARFRVAVHTGKLKVGRHRIKITVTDSTGAHAARTVRVSRCALS